MTNSERKKFGTGFPILGKIPYGTQVTKEFMKKIKADRKRGIYVFG